MRNCSRWRMPPSRARRATGWSASTAPARSPPSIPATWAASRRPRPAACRRPRSPSWSSARKKSAPSSRRTYWEVFGDFGVSAGSYRGRWFDEAFKKGAEEDARAERIWDAGARRGDPGEMPRARPGPSTEEKKPQTQIPPQLYDLTTLQREANSRFGLPATPHPADRPGALRAAQGAHLSPYRFPLPAGGLPRHREERAGRLRGSRASPATPRRRWRTAGCTRTSAFSMTRRSRDHFAIVPTGVHAETR